MQIPHAFAIMMAAAMLSIAPSSRAAPSGEPPSCDWTPQRAVTVIVPWGVGGGTDANTRRLASLLQQQMGVPFNVVNRSGGNGVVGHTVLSRSRPDGYTIGAASVEINTMHWMGLTALTYRDLTPIALVDRSAAGVLVKRDARFASLEELLDAARYAPGQLIASGTAQGGIWHLALAGMLQAEGLDPEAIRWVPSQGAGPALQELMAGGVDLATPSLSEALPQLRQGELRALAYMSDAPMAELPEVPLTAELLDSGWTLSAFVTISGPHGLPDEIACAYERAIEQAVRSDAWAQFRRSRGLTVEFEDRQQTQATLAQSDAQLGEIIEAVGLAR